MPDVLLVMAGAALGAPIRWWVDRQVQRRWLPVMPWGTFAVNLVGSFLLGVLVGARWSRGSGDDVLALVGAGLLGGMTTFSSFAWESHRLAEDGAGMLAAANVAGTVVACLAAAWLGWLLTA